MTEKIRPEYKPNKSPEARVIKITAKCNDCGWSNSLMTSVLRLAADSMILQENAMTHEKRYNHRVEFKI